MKLVGNPENEPLFAPTVDQAQRIAAVLDTLNDRMRAKAPNSYSRTMDAEDLRYLFTELSDDDLRGLAATITKLGGGFHAGVHAAVITAVERFKSGARVGQVRSIRMRTGRLTGSFFEPEVTRVFTPYSQPDGSGLGEEWLCYVNHKGVLADATCTDALNHWELGTRAEVELTLFFRNEREWF